MRKLLATAGLAGMIAFGGAAAAQESGWNTVAVKVYRDHSVDGDMCVATTLIAGPDSHVLAVSAGMTKLDKGGGGYLKIGAMMVDATDQSRVMPDDLYVTDQAGHSTQGTLLTTTDDSKKIRLFFFSLTPGAWGVADAIGRDGRYDVHFRLPGEGWRVITADILSGELDPSGDKALSSDVAGGPAGYARCVAGLGLR